MQKANNNISEKSTHSILNENWFISKLKDQSVTLLIIGGSTVITLVNGYIIGKLAPVVKDLDSLTQRVSAIESDRAVTKERFYKVEAIITPMVQNITDIKTDIRDIRTDIGSIKNSLIK